MFSAPGALLAAQAGTAKEVAACGPANAIALKGGV